jgi:putative phosphoesterase
LLRPEALEALRGCELIVHAGDVGDPAILDRLAELAPLHAVRGNVDRGPWASRLPLTAALEVEGCALYVIHILADLDLDPRVSGFRLVISGHSHQPMVRSREGVLYLNPGSAGPRRFNLPVTIARVTVDGDRADAEIVGLEVGK